LYIVKLIEGHKDAYLSQEVLTLDSFMVLDINNRTNHILTFHTALIEVHILIFGMFYIGKFKLLFHNIDQGIYKKSKKALEKDVFADILGITHKIKHKSCAIIRCFSSGCSIITMCQQTYLCKLLLRYIDLFIGFKASITDSTKLTYKIKIDKCLARIFRNEIISSNKENLKIPPEF
jgi:hypothetical protein